MRKSQTKEAPLVIKMGQQGDGTVYGLDYQSEQRIRATFPRAHFARQLFIGHDPREEHGPFWKEIAKLLTGLDDEQIEQLGGLRVVDPERRRPLWTWPPQPAAT